MSLPEKLKHDAIIEALLEVRFDTASAMAPEIVVGLLAGCSAWKEFSPKRLPLADIPPPVRDMEPSFRYQPIIELVTPNQDSKVKLGEKVVSLHVFKPYCGWNVFLPRLTQLIDHLFGVIPGANVTRLGLRYLNAFLPSLHGINAISELQVSVSVAGAPVQESFNVNYLSPVDSKTMCLVRVASPDFVVGDVPQEAKGFIDVDVFTPTGFASSDKVEIIEWLNAAHAYEKNAFFSLLSEDQIRGMNI